MNPMLACDWDENKIKFPKLAQPKIDGVRAINMLGGFTGRSKEPFKNKYTTKLYSHSALIGFDGELCAGPETASDLCRKTVSAVNTINGEPFTLWWVFDYVTPETKSLVYYDRFLAMQNRVEELKHSHPELALHLRVIPEVYSINNMEDLVECDAYFLAKGYEGTILRDPHGKHKAGRTTAREGTLMRIKRFVEEDAVVLEIQEGQSNQNEATTNALGHTERSSHQENMVPNGMVGNMKCRTVKTGEIITVAPGCMTHEERLVYFKDQTLLLNKTIKYKHFPKGVKNLPRFATFQEIVFNALRIDADKEAT